MNKCEEVCEHNHSEEPAKPGQADSKKTPCKRQPKQCSGCGQNLPKKPRKPSGPPTEKQTAAREGFKAAVKRAKELQAATPGLTYREAMKKIMSKE